LTTSTMGQSLRHMVRFAHPQFLPRLKSRVSLRRFYEIQRSPGDTDAFRSALEMKHGTRPANNKTSP
ncbi:hypothetical protein, partial [Ectothiorhodospira shaposhnikovii]|uniref:hypothetical protein n=1 Tax=Ectothiorhodospira shaposhnikovii TaxID=1054 RepID=UPI001EE99C21